MSSLFWFGSKAKSDASLELNADDELSLLHDALKGAEHIMNDDIEGAIENLSKQDSAYHLLGRGAAYFLRAALGMEQEYMKEATQVLADAESSAQEYERRSRNSSTAFRSSVYPPGTAYTLCQAETQLMSAVISVMNESLTEAVRGFLKLRRAFASLQEILNAEQRYLESNRSKEVVSNMKSINSGVEDSVEAKEMELDPVEDDEFCDAKDISVGAVALEKAGRSSTANDRQEDSLAAILTHPIDIFIHSGACFCAGTLLLILSLVPPAFSRLLTIVGFTGDRNRGLALLWQATQANDATNMSGGLAGLVLLGYYNAILRFADIVTAEDYPTARCEALLKTMSAKYPGGQMWRLEEARALATDQQLEKAVAVLDAALAKPSPVKQVQSIQSFEQGLICLILCRYEDAARHFLRTVELNTWSHGLYYYLAACCKVELYRQAKAAAPNIDTSTDATTNGNAPDTQEHNRSKAQERHLKEALSLLDKAVVAAKAKRRFFARKLPFDVFVTRKVAKWTAKAHRQGTSVIEAIGGAPMEEMAYFWGGYSRLRLDQLQQALDRLDARAEDKPDEDDAASLALLRATLLRHMGRPRAAQQILEKEVLPLDWNAFKRMNGGLADTWALPVARYEMAACWWSLSGHGGPVIDLGDTVNGDDSGDKPVTESAAHALAMCASWLDKLAAWESFDLDARVGLRVSAARATLKRFDAAK